VDEHPFVYFCPAPMPHTFFGQCPADWAIEPQRLRTSLMRSLLDNIYLSVNQRTGVVEGQVNLDDLLNSRPGSVVRMKNAGALVPIPQGGMDASAWQMVEWAEQWRENRTGFTRYSQGLNPDAFNSTATGVSIIAERADQRLELMARMASEAVERMFRKILRCVSMYQNVPEMAEVGGQWAEIDPRDWHKQYDIEIAVGLGTGSKDKQAMLLGQLLPIQREFAMAGAIDVSGPLKAAKDMAEFMGLPNPEQYFPPAQPKPQGPSPEEIKGQVTMQVEAHKSQLQQQTEQFKANLTAQVERDKQASQQAQAQAENQLEAERDHYRAQLEQVQADKDRHLQFALAQLDWAKAQLSSNTSLAVASIGAESKEAAQPQETGEAAQIAQAIAVLSATVERLSAPQMGVM